MMNKIFQISLLFILFSLPFAITSECGDIICDADETLKNCPEDCSQDASLEEFESLCGDGICQDWENANSCSDDCESLYVVPSGSGAGFVGEDDEDFFSSLLFKLIALGVVALLSILIAVIIYFAKSGPAAPVAQSAPAAPVAA